MVKAIGSIILLAAWRLTVAQDLLITNARIIDGNGGTIEQGSLLVEDGRIVSVAADLIVGGDVPIVDAEGMSLLPGFIETHTHLLLRDRSFEDQSALDRWVAQELPGDLLQYLEAGFTTAMSTGDNPDSILRVKQSIAQGSVAGPRLLVAGPIFTAPGGHPATTACRGRPEFCLKLVIQLDDPAVARNAVRRLAERGVDAIKAVYQADFPPSTPRLADDVLAALEEESRAVGLPLIVHALTENEALRAVELGVRRLVHNPGPDGLSRDNVGQLLIDASVPFSTTSHFSAPVIDAAGVERNHFGKEYEPETRAGLEHELSSIRKLWDDGVTIAFGTDHFIGDVADDIAHEIDVLSSVLSAEEIVMALTRNAATFLGLGEEIGTLEAGKVADIVIVEGDLLSDVSALKNIQVVIQGGRIVVDNR